MANVMLVMPGLTLVMAPFVMAGATAHSLPLIVLISITGKDEAFYSLFDALTPVINLLGLRACCKACVRLMRVPFVMHSLTLL